MSFDTPALQKKIKLFIKLRWNPILHILNLHALIASTFNFNFELSRTRNSHSRKVKLQSSNYPVVTGFSRCQICCAGLHQTLATHKLQFAISTSVLRTLPTENFDHSYLVPMTNSGGGKRTSSELKFVKRRNSLSPDYSSIQLQNNSLLAVQHLRVNKNRKRQLRPN